MNIRTIHNLQKRIIQRYFPAGMEVEDLEAMHREGDIDLGVMMANERES